MAGAGASSLPLSTGAHTGSRYGLASASRFLQADAGNPDTRALRASLLALSEHIEKTTRARRARLATGAIEAQAAQLARHARQQQLLLTGMGSAWQALHEFGAYQHALHVLRQALEGWRASLQRCEDSEPERFGAFERLAWRTLGEALLVLDLYEQQSGAAGPQARPPHPPRQPWLARLRRWLRRRMV